jgi:hypothetical protein
METEINLQTQTTIFNEKTSGDILDPYRTIQFQCSSYDMEYFRYSET